MSDYSLIDLDAYTVYYVLVNTMGRVYIITIFVNLIVSKRRSSPYDVPDGVQRKKMSFSANIRLYNFCELIQSRQPTAIYLY